MMQALISEAPSDRVDQRPDSIHNAPGEIDLSPAQATEPAPADFEKAGLAVDKAASPEAAHEPSALSPTPTSLPEPPIFADAPVKSDRQSWAVPESANNTFDPKFTDIGSENSGNMDRMPSQVADPAKDSLLAAANLTPPEGLMPDPIIKESPAPLAQAISTAAPEIEREATPAVAEPAAPVKPAPAATVVRKPTTSVTPGKRPALVQKPTAIAGVAKPPVKPIAPKAAATPSREASAPSARQVEKWWSRHGPYPHWARLNAPPA